MKKTCGPGTTVTWAGSVLEQVAAFWMVTSKGPPTGTPPAKSATAVPPLFVTVTSEAAVAPRVTVAFTPKLDPVNVKLLDPAHTVCGATEVRTGGETTSKTLVPTE